jgi:ribosomal 50S subunit-associated protein YjgA (DUF615 family)
MQIDEEKIRQIVREAQRELGPNADPALLRKVVREVIRELERDHTASSHCDCQREIK